MAIAEQIIQLVIFVAEGMVSPRQPIFHGARCQAGDHQQNQQKHYAAAEDPDVTCLARSMLIDEPFQEQNEACTDQYSWPPSAVPLQSDCPQEILPTSARQEHHANRRQ